MLRAGNYQSMNIVIQVIKIGLNGLQVIALGHDFLDQFLKLAAEVF